MKNNKKKYTKIILGMTALFSVLIILSFTTKGVDNQNDTDPIWKPNDAALIIIDYQPEMLAGLKTISPKKVELNVRLLARMAKTYDMPIVLSTVGVGMGYNQPTTKAIKDEMPNLKEIDRSTMNAWDDENFVKAVKATGKKKLIIVGLWTEICLVFPVVEALADGYEVMFIVDAVGGTNELAHNMAIERMIHAGAIPSTIPTISTELFRDWLSPDGKKIGPVLNWYLEETTKKEYVDIFASPSK